jgi:hypothetical protein
MLNYFFKFLAYNYKHTRDLIRAISEKVKNSENSQTILHEREITLGNYLFQHNLMVNNIGGVTVPRLLPGGNKLN